MKKKLMYLATISCFTVLLLFTPFPVKAAESTAPIGIQAQSQSGIITIVPAADFIDWVYKVENGKIYKRLYNYSKSVWIGDWIWCP